jgi:hypothetical protein
VQRWAGTSTIGRSLAHRGYQRATIVVRAPRADSKFDLGFTTSQTPKIAGETRSRDEVDTRRVPNIRSILGGLSCIPTEMPVIPAGYTSRPIL